MLTGSTPASSTTISQSRAVWLAHQAHNLRVGSSNLPSAPKKKKAPNRVPFSFCLWCRLCWVLSDTATGMCLHVLSVSISTAKAGFRQRDGKWTSHPPFWGRFFAGFVKNLPLFCYWICEIIVSERGMPNALYFLRKKTVSAGFVYTSVCKTRRFIFV